jgi:hypothetical protein
MFAHDRSVLLRELLDARPAFARRSVQGALEKRVELTRQT